MKARWSMKCACGCGEMIYTGGQFVRSRGSDWKPRHLIAYNGKRRSEGFVK